MTSAHPSSISSLLRSFRRLRVLVLGDMVADEYIVGRPTSIAREAPVIILQHSETFILPGGATNTANNLAALGARVHVVGVMGADDMGRRLIHALQQRGIGTDGLIEDPGRPTSTKTRVISQGTQEVRQHMVRVDRVDRSVVRGDALTRMVDSVCSALSRVDALLISDYENGVISQEVIDRCLPQARNRGLPIVVDSHGDLFRFRGVTAATPNQPEVESMLRVEIRTVEDLERAGLTLLEGMDAQGVLITRGSEGLALFEPGRSCYRVPVATVDHSSVVDPIGAGDTVAAVFTLAIASGADMRTAAYLSNIAGGEVVQKRGAATISVNELRAALRRTQLSPPSERLI